MRDPSFSNIREIAPPRIFSAAKAAGSLQRASSTPIASRSAQLHWPPPANAAGAVQRASTNPVAQRHAELHWPPPAQAACAVQRMSSAQAISPRPEVHRQPQARSVGFAQKAPSGMAPVQRMTAIRPVAPVRPKIGVASAAPIQPKSPGQAPAGMRAVQEASAKNAQAVRPILQPPVVQRIVYPNMNNLLTAVLGGAPAFGALDPHLTALFHDAEQQLPQTDVIANPALGRVAEAGMNPAPPPPFVLEYDPNEPDQNFLVASVLHELIHVSTERNYARGGLGGGPGLDFLNMNLPTGLVGGAIGVEMGNQDATLTANLQDAVTVTQNDNTLTVPMRNHILNRLNNYALVMPGVHYDTVLADIFAYMELGGVHNGATFNYIRRLVRESSDRRLNRPWWGVKRARRVQTAAPWAWQW